MKVLELFSGTESFSKIARIRGHKTFTIELQEKFKPDLCKDILKVSAKEIIEKFGFPDIIWASPPCTNFSIACHKHWENQEPKQETIKDIKLLHHTLKIIFELHPKFWFLENPKGRMRWILGLPPNTIYYGAYGHWCKKPTDLWGFYPKMKFKNLPKKNFNKFETMNNGKDRTILRAIVPEELCLKLIKSCENKIKK